ncbi:MAG: hypothetical protein R3B47_10995 [Bacteroidia bacterium]
MNLQAMPLQPKLRGAQLVAICKEKLVQATRDLAYFTEQSINANYVSNLFQRCEALELQLQSHQGIPRHYKLEQEVLEGLYKICEVGRRIWAQTPEKRRLYELSASRNTGVAF